MVKHYIGPQKDSESKISRNSEKNEIIDYCKLRPMVPIKDTHSSIAIESFSVLTYNILSQGNISRQNYPYTLGDSLKWKRRRECLSRELTAYKADIACFQEMDHFKDHFQPLFKKIEYDWALIERVSDVNCIAWNRDRFEMIDRVDVSLDFTTRPLFPEATPNVILIVALKSRQNPNFIYIIITSHFYWRPECHEIRLNQMNVLLESLKSFHNQLFVSNPNSTFFSIIAGDFNSNSGNLSIQRLLVHEKTGDDHERFRFLDAHAAYSGCDPLIREGYSSESVLQSIPYTTYCLYQHVLDHIIYTPFGERKALENDKPSSHGDENQIQGPRISSHSDCTKNQLIESCDELSSQVRSRLKPVALRILPDHENVVKAETALPNHIYASDHLCLHVEFSLFLE